MSFKINRIKIFTLVYNDFKVENIWTNFVNYKNLYLKIKKTQATFLHLFWDAKNSVLII